MKKTVIKTALITLISLVALFVLTFFSLFFFFPKALEPLASDFGLDRLALTLSVREYEKTGGLDDLSRVLARAGRVGDDGVVVAYTPKMTDDADFLTHVEGRTVSVGTRTLDYKSYVIGNYLLALYRTGEKQETLLKAASYFTAFYTGYTAYNPYDVLAKNAGSFSSDFNEDLYAAIDALGGEEPLCEADLILRAADLILITNALGQ